MQNRTEHELQGVPEGVSPIEPERRVSVSSEEPTESEEYYVTPTEPDLDKEILRTDHEGSRLRRPDEVQESRHETAFSSPGPGAPMDFTGRVKSNRRKKIEGFLFDAGAQDFTSNYLNFILILCIVTVVLAYLAFYAFWFAFFLAAYAIYATIRGYSPNIFES